MDLDACIFCTIFRRESPASWIYEDERVGVILTIEPVNAGHALVIPKVHARRLADLSEVDGQYMFTVAQRTAAALCASGLRCEGVNLFLADGVAAFQSVHHVHLHVFPRFKGDPFKIDADWHVNPARDELDAHASRIREAFGAA
ncbi:MAG: HIT family protein [Planctomycetota bacterium]